MFLRSIGKSFSMISVYFCTSRRHKIWADLKIASKYIRKKYEKKIFFIIYKNIYTRFFIILVYTLIDAILESFRE